MASITSGKLVDAVLRVERMSFQDRQQLAEEILAAQPNLFAVAGQVAQAPSSSGQRGRQLPNQGVFCRQQASLNGPGTLGRGAGGRPIRTDR